MKTYLPFIVAVAGVAIMGCGGSSGSGGYVGPARIVFSSTHEGRTTEPTQLYSMELDGSDVQRITELEYGASEPAASDDGQYLAFTIGNGLGGHPDIGRMDRHGRQITNLTNYDADDISPCYCGDGTEVVFTSSRTGKRQVYKMSADGSNVTKLTGFGMLSFIEHYEPDFSHDNQRIVFVSALGEQIWLMNGDGSEPRATLLHGRTPKFNEHGTMLVYSHGGVIYTARVDGTDAQRLTPPSDYYFRDPAFSPEGKYVVFEGENGSTEIFRINVDGSNLRQLTNLGADSKHPTFIHDSTRVEP
jgi:TolB protein